MAQKKQTVKGKSQTTKKVVSRTTVNKNVKNVKPIGKVSTKTTDLNKKTTSSTEKNGETRTKIPKKKLDPKTLEIIAALGVLIAIISYFTMGLFTTIILIVGIALILGLSHLLGKMAQNTKKRKVLNILIIAFLGLCILGSVAVGGLLIYVVKTAPEFDPNNLKNKESSIIYSAAGNEKARLGTELRENISYDDLPQVFIDALIATEDSRFFQHNGFDAPRFIKASLGQLAGKDAGGASTLSMQVIKNSYTSSESEGLDGIIRKFTDIYLSVFKLEKNYTKEQIIEFYVNNHGLGGTIFGVEEAAQTYFGKSIKDVNLAEAATIAGMFQAPTSYNPITKPERSEKRRNTVLNLMVRHGYISQEEAEITKKISVEDLVTGNSSSNATFEDQAYIDAVLDELNDKYGISYTNTPVLIYTNMDEAKQAGLNDIFNGKTFTWANDKVQSGVAVVENSTGKLVAIGAGRNRQTQRGLSYASSLRQIGSTAKPIFDYGPGMEFENWSTYQQFVDEPWSYTNGPSVNNSDGKFMGQISLRTALAQSRNIPALKAFQSLNKDQLKNFVTSLGIVPEDYLHEAHALGAFKGATPIQMAAAYAAFANGGYYTEPYTITKIVYRDTGKEIIAEPERKQVMSDSTAFMITDVLKTAVTSGLSSGARIQGVNIAAKTGTSSFDDKTKELYKLPKNAINDAWIVGYDPEYAIGMWYGYDNIKDGYNTDTQAVVQRGKLYQALGKAVFAKNGQDFTVPNSVVKSAVEVGSNPALLPSENTPQDQITYEYFKAGTEPTEVSSKYQKLDTVTNLTGSYDRTTKKVTLRWTGIPTPAGNTGYGDFGYNIYFGDTLLGFTKETTYSFETEAPNGTYKVVSTFQKHTENQSSPASTTIKVEPEKPEDPDDSKEPTTANYKTTLVGNQYITVAIGGTFKDSNPPITVTNTDTKENVTAKVIAANGLTTTIKDENQKVVKEITTEKAATFTVTYNINYNGYKTSLTRTVTIK